MAQFIYFKSIIFSLFLIFFTVNTSQGACYFPTQETVINNSVTKKQVFSKKKFKSKVKRKVKKNPLRDDRFGNLALWALVAALASSLIAGIFAISMLGTFLMGLFFVASCGFAIYGLYKDESKRKARIILIINMALILSFIASFWIIALFTL